MPNIECIFVNQAVIRIKCGDYGVYRELEDHFKFHPPNHTYMPAFRNKSWDGFVRLFSARDRLLPFGLITYLCKFAKDSGYTIKFDDEIKNTLEVFKTEDLTKFIESLNMPFKLREYQMDTFINSIKQGRSTIISPTSSGKSAVIYAISAFWTSRKKRTLLVVPTTSLVEQMVSDFKSYGSKLTTHMIYAGKPKDSDADVVVSTWQSLMYADKKWFEQFDCLIVDECHQAKAKELTRICKCCVNASKRYGTTGTLDDIQANVLTIEGNFGIKYIAATTKQLMDKNFVSQLKIKAVVLKYTADEISRQSWQKEMEFIANHKKRNHFIRNLANGQTGNCLVLFKNIAHGELLYNLIKETADDKNVYYIAGNVDTQRREYIRNILESSDNNILVASSGTTSTGINIPSLKSVIFAAPYKSKIRNLQSLGRVLRLKEGKDGCTLFDIADDLTFEGKPNYTLKHFEERLKIYKNEKFKYTVSRLDFMQ